ncbi:MAG: uncharacterized protein KVP18_005217 [Porospora cf. gigantea A]|uniref:uncharacterized protein n=1 Tax=Porospora cf. gigantea A TaxID=2853593 RepID=UPI00355939F3|nr:MAG: hypothetical protein KVP18_005217 [Porospora cf. gigantea A]
MAKQAKLQRRTRLVMHEPLGYSLDFLSPSATFDVVGVFSNVRLIPGWAAQFHVGINETFENIKDCSAVIVVPQGEPPLLYQHVVISAGLHSIPCVVLPSSQDAPEEIVCGIRQDATGTHIERLAQLVREHSTEVRIPFLSKESSLSPLNLQTVDVTSKQPFDRNLNRKQRRSARLNLRKRA